jgi:hypothetical protein
MIWRDILVERPVPDERLTCAFADAFGIASSAVVVIDDFLTTPTADTVGRNLVIERRRVRGDAALDLCVFDLGLDHESVVVREMDILTALAARLGSAVITDAADIDPSRFLRISESGEVQPVLIDDARLDAEGYVAVSTPEAIESGAS